VAPGKFVFVIVGGVCCLATTVTAADPYWDGLDDDWALTITTVGDLTWGAMKCPSTPINPDVADQISMLPVVLVPVAENEYSLPASKTNFPGETTIEDPVGAAVMEFAAAQPEAITTASTRRMSASIVVRCGEASRRLPRGMKANIYTCPCEAGVKRPQYLKPSGTLFTAGSSR
jgi:hypothetical protein